VVVQTNTFADLSTLAALGELRNVDTNQCVDSLWHDRVGQVVGLYGCHGQGGTQTFAYLRTSKDIRPIQNLDVCLLSTFKLGKCTDKAAKWDYTAEGYLLHEESNHCLAVTEEGSRTQPKMLGCGTEGAHLVWKLATRDAPMLFGAKVDHPDNAMSTNKTLSKRRVKKTAARTRLPKPKMKKARIAKVKRAQQ
jgi:hypothetical protein